MTRSPRGPGRLLALQREVAALIMEEDARRAFAANPRRYARARGLTGADATRLAGLDAADVGYFAARRQIDRRAMLAADLPQAVARSIHEKGLLAFFRAYPYALEDPLQETARFAAWARRAAETGRISGFVADLAAYEAAEVALRARPHRCPRPSARARRAPGLRLLHLDHDLERALAARGVPQPKPHACDVILLQGHHGFVAGEVAPLVAAILRAANGRRTDAQVCAEAARQVGIASRQAARALAELRREGVLSPKP